ncbi:hypothetical protein HYU72_01030 [Candidatus Berkelbacteria bacterium]|nr:hypothetical protein [Candidatus Berkelbacteria bacterium]
MRQRKSKETIMEMENNGHANEKEYETLSQKGMAREQFLHNTINLHIILQIVLFIVGYILYLQDYDIVLFVLFIPIFLNSMTFNYQSSQSTLEEIGRYINKHYKELKWERSFAEHREHYKFEAFFKVLPLLFPNTIPIALLVLQTPLNQWEIVILVFDLVLLLIMIESFRYKLRRVK